MKSDVSERGWERVSLRFSPQADGEHALAHLSAWWVFLGLDVVAS